MPVLVQIAIALVAASIVAAGAFGGYAAFKTTRNTAIIANYETSVKSWKERSEAQDNEISRLKDTIEADRDKHAADMQQCADQYGELRGRFEALSSVVTGATAVERLENLVSQHFEEVSGRLSMIENLVHGEPIQTPRTRPKRTETPT